MTDKLTEAKNHLANAEQRSPPLAAVSAQCAIAAALIALCERVDNVTNDEGALNVHAMNWDAHRMP